MSVPLALAIAFALLLPFLSLRFLRPPRDGSTVSLRPQRQPFSWTAWLQAATTRLRELHEFVVGFGLFIHGAVGVIILILVACYELLGAGAALAKMFRTEHSPPPIVQRQQQEAPKPKPDHTQKR